MRSLTSLTALVAVAAILLVPSLASGAPAAGVSARGPIAPGPDLGRGAMSSLPTGPLPALLPWAVHPMSSSTLRNALVDAPCDSQSNAEVESAYDRSAGILYDAWIGCGGIGFSRSLDQGYSFQPAITVRGSANVSSWDPSVAIAPNGTVYVGYMRNNGTGGAPAVAWSWDHGKTFAGFADAFQPNAQEFSDRDFLAVAPNGTLYLTWDYSPNSSIDAIGCAPAGSCYFTAGDYNILLVRSSSGGVNWSSPVPVSTGYPNGGAPCGPLVVTPTGAIDVLWEGYAVNATTHALGLGRNYLTRSTDGGNSFSSAVPVSPITFPNTDWWIDGAVSVDRSGTLYATYDGGNGTADDAYVSVLRNSSSNWSAPLRLNPDNTSAPHIMAESAGAENGTAFVAWMSNNSSAGWSTFVRIVSGNGSVVSAVDVVSNQYGLDGYWVGDTLGLSYLGSGLVAVSWTSTLGSSPFPTPQIYSATLGLTLPGPPRIMGLLPGDANATVTWAPPTSGGPVDGYEVDWGVEGQHAFAASVGRGTTEYLLTGLVAGVHYVVEVAAANTAGVGPFSSPANLTLTAWANLQGSVVPSNASIEVDRAPIAVDPGGRFAVNTTPGAHVILARLPGFFPLSQAVELSWNRTTEVQLALLPEPGAVRGVVEPPTALVRWDGVAVGLGISGGYSEGGTGGTVHWLNVSSPEYVPVAEQVTIPRNGTVWVNISLLRANGTLELVVRPSTATVWLAGEGVALDRSGRANLSRAPGVYSVEATAPGFEPRFDNVTLGSSLLVLSVNLTAVPPPSTNRTFGVLGVPWYGWGIAGVAVALLGLAYAQGRRRRRDRVSSEPPSDGDGLYPLARLDGDAPVLDEGGPGP